MSIVFYIRKDCEGTLDIDRDVSKVEFYPNKSYTSEGVSSTLASYDESRESRTIELMLEVLRRLIPEFYLMEYGFSWIEKVYRDGNIICEFNYRPFDFQKDPSYFSKKEIVWNNSNVLKSLRAIAS